MKSIIDTITFEAASLTNLDLSENEDLKSMEEDLSTFLNYMEQFVPEQNKAVINDVENCINDIIVGYSDAFFKHGLATGIALVKEAQARVDM